MDFRLTEQEEQFRRVVRDFTARELVPRAADIDARAAFPVDLLPKMGELGIFGILIPSGYGGSDAGMLSYLIAIEELSVGCASTAFTAVCTATLGSVLNALAPEEVRSRTLPAVAVGKAMGSFGITEPDAGEDIGAVQMAAREEGACYRLDGHKVFISNAGLARLYGIMTRTRPGYGPDGLSMFLVEKERPGFSIGKMENKMGLRGHPLGELIFQDCLVPAENMLGAEGGGMQPFMASLGPALLGCGASSVGIARAAFEKAVAHAKERHTFGQPIGRHQAVQIMLFDMATALEASRLLLYRAGANSDRGQLDPVEAFRAKLFSTEMGVDVTYKAMQVHGAYGYSAEFPLERHYRDARAHTLHMQTPEVARTLGASLMLGFGPPGPGH